MLTRVDGTKLDKIINYDLPLKGGAEYYANNSDVVSILMDLTAFGDGSPTPNANHVLNPGRHVFLEVKQASGTGLPGVGRDGVYRDPWGNPYIITLDLGFDGMAVDGAYGKLRKGKGVPPNILKATLPREILVWSFGPDGKADIYPATGSDPNAKPIGDNKDNICSWEL